MSALSHFESLGRLFYVVSPNRTTFQRTREVPAYFDRSTPDLVLLFFLEICICIYLKKHHVRMNDVIACLSQGILLNLTRLLVPSGQFAVYIYLYSNWRIVDLPWNSPYTWWICFLLIDFAYYWMHRYVHEINFLWATHHVHHSSEDYNISTNVRQSILQVFTSWILYLPLAFVLPPSMYLVHIQFNYIYQFWIHTELVRSLGPLEYVLNTPSHHRVHHGSNRNCIDKNFGGTLIIWDRIFGTFAPEKEEIVYGLTEPVRSFNPFIIQFDHCIRMWKTFMSYEGWRNKLSVLFKGPGWSPGKPRLGNPEDIPDVKAPVQKYDQHLPFWWKVYLLWHFFILVQGYLKIMKSHRVLAVTLVYGSMSYIVFSLVCIGALLDKSQNSHWMELLRCTSYLVLDRYFLSSMDVSLSSIHAKWVPEVVISLTFIASFVLCLLLAFVSGISVHQLNAEKSKKRN